MREWYCQICGELIIGTDQPQWFGMDPDKEYNHAVCAMEARLVS